VKDELGVDGIVIGQLYDAVISRMVMEEDGEKYALCLLVYRCTLTGGAIPGGDEEHVWAPARQAREFIANKYPASFLDRLFG
jgi:hypothetical protein